MKLKSTSQAVRFYAEVPASLSVSTDITTYWHIISGKFSLLRNAANFRPDVLLSVAPILGSLPDMVRQPQI